MEITQEVNCIEKKRSSEHNKGGQKKKSVTFKQNLTKKLNFWQRPTDALQERCRQRDVTGWRTGAF